MAKNIALRIKVEFVETEAEPSSDRCPQEQVDGSFSLVLPEADELNISALDRAALDVSFPALREAVSRYLAKAGKKKLHRQAQRLKPSLVLREQASGYRVEGEIGRFDFPLYEAVDASRRVICRGVDFFPKRQPREWHKTEGFREEALCLEASKRRYRDNTAHLNRYRRQPQGGTPVTTLQDNAQKEGSRVLSFLERHSQSVLQAHGFDAEGQASEVAVARFKAGTDKCLSAKRVNQGLTGVCQEMAARGFSPAQIATVQSQAARAVHEDPAHCTNVAIDDVEVKKQKAQRECPTATEAFAQEGPSSAVANGTTKRPKVANTVARIEQGAKRFTLSGGSVGQVLRFVLAFLLNNALLSGRVHFFTDGYKKPAKYDCGLLCLAPPGVATAGLVSLGQEIQRGLEPGVSRARHSQSALGCAGALVMVRPGERSAPVSGRNPCRGSQRHRGD